MTECGCGACQRNIKAILATTPTPSEKAGKVCCKLYVGEHHAIYCSDYTPKKEDTKMRNQHEAAWKMVEQYAGEYEAQGFTADKAIGDNREAFLWLRDQLTAKDEKIAALTLTLAESRELEEMLGDSLVRADRAENKAVGMAIKIRYALQDAEWQYERAIYSKNTDDLSHWGGRIAQYEEFFKGLRDEERKADVARATLAALAAATPPQQES